MTDSDFSKLDDALLDHLNAGDGPPEEYPGEAPGEVFDEFVAPEDASPSTAAPARPKQSRVVPNEPSPGTGSLRDLLKERFGHQEFRPFQEAVCRTATEGQDLLLVMPTGAGKSLCYQLPGLARGGTTLVISPLIALMEDQVAGLQAGGFRAERIHSGRQRAESRHVCVDYLAGRLDYLFIAPERLSVPGFPEMLARRKPALIAIDEAHCISHWGHDFRPDYRKLSERLPLLRPSPVIALTATATPMVQRDIVQQLDIPNAQRFIHGFRRTNIALENVQMKPSARTEATDKILANPDHRPAIVYAPTRKQAEALAAHLAQRYPAAVYHAGLPAAERDQVQARFLGGQLEVIVATIAFGMGIDKADVRTVVHTALPSSVEGYYQEIGRAGRDGLPSRAILLAGFSDRRTHEFFMERDYPDPATFKPVVAALGNQPLSRFDLQQRVQMEDDALDNCLEKLWVHGGAIVDAEENVTRGDDGWLRKYQAQRRHKLEQLALITRYTDSRDCRMLHLVRYFGDQEDNGQPCGTCDVCSPATCIALEFRPPSGAEIGQMERIVDSLARRNSQTNGQLHRDLFSDSLPRNSFERLMAALVRAGYIDEQRDSFEKDGRVIEFSRALLTVAGRESPDFSAALIAREAQAPPKKAAARRGKARPRAGTPAGGGGTKPGGFVVRLEETPEEDAPQAVVEALRAWRTTEARRQQVPAFCIFSNRTLLGLARVKPENRDGLLRVKGVGPKLVEKYGDAVLAILQNTE